MGVHKKTVGSKRKVVEENDLTKPTIVLEPTEFHPSSCTPDSYIGWLLLR